MDTLHFACEEQREEYREPQMAEFRTHDGRAKESPLLFWGTGMTIPNPTPPWNPQPRKYVVWANLTILGLEGLEYIGGYRFTGIETFGAAVTSTFQRLVYDDSNEPISHLRFGD